MTSELHVNSRGRLHFPVISLRKHLLPLSFPIRTLPSVPEFHRIGLHRRFMDYTIGQELHLPQRHLFFYPLYISTIGADCQGLEEITVRTGPGQI